MFKFSDQKWEITDAEMCKNKRRNAIKFAKEAIQNQSHTKYNDIAVFITSKFEKLYGGTWSCIVGIDQDFQACVYHKNNSYIDFRCGELGIVLFKSKVLFNIK